MIDWSVARAVETFCLAVVKSARNRPAVVGLQGPQGAGKTTLTRRVLAQAAELGLSGASVSIDDFYVTRDEQLRLAAAHPGNPYLEHRGYPGTHDIALGVRTITALRSLDAGASMRLPRYDKTAHGGRGDRAPESAWPLITGPLDLVIVEGWMLGFEPVAEADLPDPMLAVPNRALAAYGRWHRLLDAFVVLRPRDWRYVLRWRVEAEERTKAAGRPGLSADAIEDYVRRFLPAYATWAGRAPASLPSSATAVIDIDAERSRIDGTD
jgi:D-glycerate 3-kinase